MEAIEAAVQERISDEQRQQRLIPGINFTCHGFITKWILGAKWMMEDNYPELQIWNSSDGTTYVKQSTTVFTVDGGSNNVSIYEYIPDPAQEFHDGDIFGIFIPDESRYKVFFIQDEDGPVNFAMNSGSMVSNPPEGDFDTSGKTMVNEVPLIAVEVCEL